MAIWHGIPISMHKSGRCTVSHRHTLPSSARRRPEVGAIMSWPLASAQRWADAGPMRRSGICPASGRCRANIWADVGPMPGKCQADANAYPTIIADSIHVYIGPTSARHRPDISPTSAQHRPNIGPTSADANTCPTIIADSILVYIGPTSAQHRSDIGPISV